MPISKRKHLQTTAEEAEAQTQAAEAGLLEKLKKPKVTRLESLTIR